MEVRETARLIGFTIISVPIGIFLTFAGYMAWDNFKTAPPPARIVHSYWLESDVIQQGEPLRVWSDVTVNEVCPALIQRYISTKETDETPKGNVFSTSGVPQVTLVKEHQIVPNIQRFPDIGLGEFTYRTVVFDNCRDRSYVINSPELPFKIVPRRVSEIDQTSPAEGVETAPPQQ